MTDETGERGQVGRWRKRPVEVEAVQWTGDNVATIKAFVDEPRHFGVLDDEDRLDNPDATAELWVNANGRWLPIQTGEWVIRDSAGCYPCKPDIFEATYEPALSGSEGQENQ